MALIPDPVVPDREGLPAPPTPHASGRRFHRPFRIQVGAVLFTMLGLTVAHFALAAGGLSWVATNVLFLAGLGLASAVLLCSSRLAEREVARGFGKLEHSYVGAVSALSGALDARDGYTGDHASSVDALVAKTGRALGLAEAELEILRHGALFHDIGKIGIPDSILNKPGPLTEVEWAVMRQHPVIGAEILAPLDFLAPALLIVRHEHEHWDGSGYPDGLSGEQIPIGARIVLVCDAYHAMTSDRPYRAALPTPEAVRRLREASGAQFDPRVVKAFLDVLESTGQMDVPEELGIGTRAGFYERPAAP